MLNHLLLGLLKVHCRIGSLEKCDLWVELPTLVHCRIGSLETQQQHLVLNVLVHCRIGSLEK